VNYHDFTIPTVGADDCYICTVLKNTSQDRKCYFFKETDMGSVFGGCTCGALLIDGVPCHHMVAVVKSSKLEGLNSNNAMPKWWTTAMWRLQFPKR
jgi:hypothetical protein